jgi:hypothetical protein
MDDELKQRFFKLKLQELLTDSTRPFPTYIFERERPEVLELVRMFCLLSPTIIYCRADNFTQVPEQLERKPVTDYGDLYYLVFLS